MNPDFQRRVQRYGWDKAASYYEPSWQRQLRPAQDRLLDVAALQPGERVLDPGGRAVSVVWGRRDRCGWAGVFPIMDRRVQSDVCPLFFQLGTGSTLSEAFRAAGFTEVATERFSVALPFSTPEEACEAAFWGGAVALAWRKFDEEKRAGARAEHLESIAPYRNEHGYDIPGEFVVTRGVKPNR